MPCRQRRALVQELSPDSLKDLSERLDSNYWSAVPEMPFAKRVNKNIWYLTVLNAENRSSKISVEYLEAAFASVRASVTESKAFSVK